MNVRLPLAVVALLTTAAAVPDRTCAARAYGASGDGVTLDTAAIQRAVDDCAGKPGGGIVLLDRGTFLSGTIVLKDHVTLRIAPSATLLASPRIVDFAPYPAADVPLIAVDGSTQNKGNGPYHLIHAENARDIAIDGGGTVRGNGQAYWDPDREKVWVSRRARPSPLIEFVASDGIRVENLTIADAAGWTIHPLDSRHVRMARLTIRNDPRGPNTDAINIDSSRDVSVAGADIVAGDDCVVLKTTGRRGKPVGATERVRVSDVRCSSDDQGIKIGTESLGDFRNIRFERIFIYRAAGVYRAPTAAISLSMVDGARFSDVRVSNVTIEDAATPLFLRLGNRGRGQAVPTVGALSDVVFENIAARGGTLASSITGLPGHPVRGVTLRNVDVIMRGGAARPSGAVPEAPGDYPHAPMFGALPASGLYVRHVEGLTLRNVRFGTAQPDSGPPIVFDDVRGARLDRTARIQLGKQ